MGFLSSLSPQQKKLIFLGVPIFFMFMMAGSYFIKRTRYAPLFTNLSLQDGAAVVRELEADKIPFLLGGNGSVIEVPRQVVYRTRLQLAGKGIPMGGGVGFEIFEKTPFGVSEFTQQVNYLRALQGELTRTINALDAVQSSRVHLALPSRSNFLGPEEKPSASVVLELKPGYHLTSEQVQGVVHLIATSVPKLAPEKVSVLDTSGRLLQALPGISGGSDPELLHQLKTRYEKDVERRIETMLDPVLGPGRVVARVNIQMSFQETQLTREQFDPSNQVVRAQQQMMDDSVSRPAGVGGVPGVQGNVPGAEGTKAKEGPAKKSGQVVSYEVGRTTSRVFEPKGQVQRLSVAVLVDGNYEGEEYSPRSPEEMESIKGIIMKAVGFNAERGDQVELANIPFKAEPLPPSQAAQAPDLRQWVSTPQGIGAAAGLVLLVVVAAFALSRRRRKGETDKPVADSTPQQVEVKESIAGVFEKIVAAPDVRREQLSQIARDYPEASVHIIRMWLEEEVKKGSANNGHDVAAVQ